MAAREIPAAEIMAVALAAAEVASAEDVFKARHALAQAQRALYQAAMPAGAVHRMELLIGEMSLELNPAGMADAELDRFGEHLGQARELLYAATGVR